jgi:hypothetical protein
MSLLGSLHLVSRFGRNLDGRYLSPPEAVCRMRSYLRTARLFRDDPSSRMKSATVWKGTSNMRTAASYADIPSTSSSAREQRGTMDGLSSTTIYLPTYPSLTRILNCWAAAGSLTRISASVSTDSSVLCWMDRRHATSSRKAPGIQERPSCTRWSFISQAQIIDMR